MSEWDLSTIPSDAGTQPEGVKEPYSLGEEAIAVVVQMLRDLLPESRGVYSPAEEWKGSAKMLVAQKMQGLLYSSVSRTGLGFRNPDPAVKPKLCESEPPASSRYQILQWENEQTVVTLCSILDHFCQTPRKHRPLGSKTIQLKMIKG